MPTLEQEINLLKDEVEKIKARNRRVEADKAWELSKTRNAFIAVSTYILIFAFMVLIGDEQPFLNALVASVGYLISASTYGILKNWWLKKKRHE